MSFISDLIINVSAFRITIGNKINALKTLIDGKQNTLVDGLHTKVNSNKTDVAFDVNTPVKDKSNKDRLLFGNTVATDVVIKGAVANGDFRIKDNTDADLFIINGANKVPSFPQLPAPQTGDANLAIFDAGTSLWKHSLKISDLPKKTDLDNYITRNTAETVNAKKQWTTAQTMLRNGQAGLRVLHNIAVHAASISTLTSDNYFLVDLGYSLPSVMWEAEIEIYQYNGVVTLNTERVRPMTFKITGYNSSVGGSFVNRSVSQTAGDTHIMESVTFFRDANNRIIIGFKSNIIWSYPRVYLKRISLYHNVNDTQENAIVNNANISCTNDVSTLTSILVVPNANIVKNVDSSNVNTIVTDTNNYLDTILTTNGTTAGTVYIFKRVGLSDLTLTLTAASASFSGVVTTGTQTFEGVKTFLKSPKVPIAVNSDEAVNKAQMDAADVNGNAAYSFGDHRLAGYWNIKNPTGYIGLTDLNLAIGGSRGLAQPTVANTTHAGFSDIVTIAQYGPDDLVQLELPFRNNGYFGFRTKSTAGWTNMTYLWHSDNFNPAQYVMISALNTTLAGYATLAGTQTFTGQITYTQAPIVPNGTLAGHTVNLGQLNLKADITYVNSQIAAVSGAIPTNNNQLANGAGYITAAALGGYVLQTSLTTQLANYVTANGVQNITATKTFTVSPVVPNGTLAGHTVNLGQMQSYVTGLGYTTLAAVQTWVNSQGYLTSAALNGYVLQSSLNIQLANYATLAGTQTFTGTNTFTQSPVVPAGSLSGHTVNLGQMQTYVANQIANIPTQTDNRIYDPTDPVNNDYWDKINIKSFRHAYGFDVCNYEPQAQEYVSIFDKYGAPYLNDGILGSIALICPHNGTPVIKGTVESQVNLNQYINNNEIYFCLRYYRDTASPSSFSGELMMLSSIDVANYIGYGNVEMFNGVIILGVATADNTLMVQHREF